ncbi:alpha/beta hydrolase [Marilutibacter aestuarii]
MTRRHRNARGESAHRFGPGLVGILHRPCHPAGHVQPVAVILLNAGLTGRAGPYREYVTLARALARAGFTVFRYDQSGLGDSQAPMQQAGDRRQREARAAMTLVGAETGLMRFVMGGLCSGADDAFHLAGDDPRIVGAIMLDGIGYRTPQFWLRHLLPRMFSPRRWLSAVARLRDRNGSGPTLLDYRDFPEQVHARAQLRALVDRDVRLLCIYTSGSYYYVNHAGQLAGALGPAARARQVSVEFWRDCDHTFYLRRDREKLFARTVDWMRDNFANRADASLDRATP